MPARLFLIGATQLNAALLRRFEPRVLLPFGLVAGHGRRAACCSCSRRPAPAAIVGVVAPLWTVLFAIGLVLPNAPALALARHGEAAGTASALLGAIQIGGARSCRRWSACSATTPSRWAR